MALTSCNHHSRVVLPMEWSFELKMTREWLENYRLFLNGLQMWNSRAAFDVGRFEHLRRLKQGGSAPSLSRHGVSSKKQHQKDMSQSNFPPQLWARCNYCNASLPLSKLRGNRKLLVVEAKTCLDVLPAMQKTAP